MTPPQHTEKAQASQPRAESTGKEEFALPPATASPQMDPRALANPRALTSSAVLFLQRSIGNHETARLLSPARQPKAQAAPQVAPPVIHPQLSGSEFTIQRAIAHVHGQTGTLRLKEQIGEMHKGRQLYLHSKTETQYIYVGENPYTGSIIVEQFSSTKARGTQKQEKPNANPLRLPLKNDTYRPSSASSDLLT